MSDEQPPADDRPPENDWEQSAHDFIARVKALREDILPAGRVSNARAVASVLRRMAWHLDHGAELHGFRMIWDGSEGPTIEQVVPFRDGRVQSIPLEDPLPYTETAGGPAPTLAVYFAGQELEAITDVAVRADVVLFRTDPGSPAHTLLMAASQSPPLPVLVLRDKVVVHAEHNAAPRLVATDGRGARWHLKRTQPPAVVCAGCGVTCPTPHLSNCPL